MSVDFLRVILPHRLALEARARCTSLTRHVVFAAHTVKILPRRSVHEPRCNSTMPRFRVGGLRAMRSSQTVAPRLPTARRPLSEDIASSLGSSTSPARSRCFVSEHTSLLDVHARRSLRSPLHAGKKHKQLWSALCISVTVSAAWTCRFAQLSQDLWPSASRRPFKRSQLRQLRVQHLAFQGCWLATSSRTCDARINSDHTYVLPVQ